MEQLKFFLNALRLKLQYYRIFLYCFCRIAQERWALRHIPKREQWLYKNEGALYSVTKGLEQAKNGELTNGPDLERLEVRYKSIYSTKDESSNRPSSLS